MFKCPVLEIFFLNLSNLLMLLNCGVGEDSWESLGLQGDPTSPFWRRSAPGFLWKEWCSSWNSSTLATSCEELTHWKRLWCWEGLGAGGEGDDRGWDGWMAIWLDGRESEWTPGDGDGQGGLVRCDSWGRKESDTTERLNWTELKNTNASSPRFCYFNKRWGRNPLKTLFWRKLPELLRTLNILVLSKSITSPASPIHPPIHSFLFPVFISG